MFHKLLCISAFLAVWTAPTHADTAGTCSTISAAAAATPELSGLVTALDTTGLTDTFNVVGDPTAYTVFAPNNDAFTAALAAIGSNGNLTSDQVDQLTQILQAHVAKGAYDANQLMTQQPNVPTLLDGVNLTSDGSTVTIGDSSAMIVMPDAATELCGGSVVHIIDTVMIPPGVVLDATPAPPAPPSNCTTIASAATDANLTTLVTLLTEADLADPFTDQENTDTYTVFAPNDEAFQAVLASLGNGQLTADQLDMLGTVLKVHVVNGAYDAANLTAGGGQMMQTLDDNTQLSSDGMTVSSGNNTATIVKADAVTMLCGGSVVHIIDAVLMPSSDEDSSGTDSMPQPPLPPGASPRPSPPGTSPSPASGATGLMTKFSATLVALSVLVMAIA